MKKINYYKIAAPLLWTTLLFGCAKDPTLNQNNSVETEQVMAETVDASTVIGKTIKYDEDDFYSEWKNDSPIYIEFNGNAASFDSAAPVIYQNQELTIKTGGTYVISGNLDNGKILVDAEDKSTVRLVLNGVNITSSEGPAIQVVQAEKTVISLEEGTENSIVDGKEYVLDEDSEVNAAIFSKDDLSINGTGTLVVQANYNNGITSKDNLKITGGDIHISAVDDGIMGRDLVAIKEGSFTLEVGGDGIKSSNDKDASVGIVALEGGTFDITAANDGVQAESSLWITDGAYNITAGGGSPETIAVNEGMQRNSRVTTSTVETESMKGLKAVVDIAISSGTFDINSSDDAIHSNNTVTIAGGEFTVSSGDDGIHADVSIATTGGNIDITKSYEGIESQLIVLGNGNIQLTSSDDGINVGGGNDDSGMDMSTSSAGLLQINGGTITVNASGDGLDSNGSIAMTGGTVMVNGPTSSNNGALDYDGSFDISGGLMIAAGSSGMVQTSSDQSAQASILMTYPTTQAAGTMVHLEDSKGENIISFEPAKQYQAVFISSPELEKDSSYTLYSGGSASGSNVGGLFSDGEYKGGTKVIDFATSEMVTWLNETGVTTAQNSGPGGMRGGGGFTNPDGSTGRPERGNPGDMFADLDEETKAEAQKIIEQVNEGTLTMEEAEQQLVELGVEFIGRGIRP
jgi:hypothetical protein